MPFCAMCTVNCSSSGVDFPKYTDAEKMALIKYEFYNMFSGDIAFMMPVYELPTDMLAPYYTVVMNRIKRGEIDVNYQDSFLRGATPLMMAVRLNDLSGMQYLLENGVDVNKIDYHYVYNHAPTTCGRTALHYASILNHDNAYQLLLEFGASEIVRDADMKTPREVRGLAGNYCLYKDYKIDSNFKIISKTNTSE